MKKLYLLIVTVLLFTSPTFAYYGEYYEPKTSVWDIFIAIVTIVCAILGIILFFKLWGMTNNVRKITEKYLAPKIKEDDILLSYYLQKNTKGEEFAKQNLMDCIVMDILNSEISSCFTRKAKEDRLKGVENKYKEVLTFAKLEMPNMEEYLGLMSPKEYKGFKIGEKVQCVNEKVIIYNFNTEIETVQVSSGGIQYNVAIDKISKLTPDEPQA